MGYFTLEDVGLSENEFKCSSKLGLDGGTPTLEIKVEEGRKEKVQESVENNKQKIKDRILLILKTSEELEEIISFFSLLIGEKKQEGPLWLLFENIWKTIDENSPIIEHSKIREIRDNTKSISNSTIYALNNLRTNFINLIDNNYYLDSDEESKKINKLLLSGTKLKIIVND